jgi:uncharacterized repeat protein (TIGR02543 family)
MKRISLLSFGLLLIFSLATVVFNSCSNGDDEPGNENGKGKQISCTVTFDSGGGTSVPSQTVEIDGTVTVPADPVRQGYTFVFWHLKGAVTAYDFNTPVNSDITLVAKWDEIFYTVTFDSDGGTSVQSQTVRSDDTVTVPANPERQGYTFVFWYLEDAATAYDFSTPVSSDITLVAKWSEIFYTVTFDSNGGTSVQSQTVKSDSAVIVPANPTRQGYTFVFWHLEGATTAYNFKTPVNSDITLVAKWNEIPSVVKAEWYVPSGSPYAIYNPIRAVCYFKWPTVYGATTYALYRSTSATGTGTLLGQTSDLSIRVEEAFASAGTYTRYYWVIATINGGKTVRPDNGGIKVTYTVTLASKVWMPGAPPNYTGGYWMTIGSDNLSRFVEQNPIR